jgi:hypothetical protein
MTSSTSRLSNPITTRPEERPAVYSPPVLFGDDRKDNGYKTATADDDGGKKHLSLSYAESDSRARCRVSRKSSSRYCDIPIGKRPLLSSTRWEKYGLVCALAAFVLWLETCTRSLRTEPHFENRGR